MGLNERKRKSWTSFFPHRRVPIHRILEQRCDARRGEYVVSPFPSVSKSDCFIPVFRVDQYAETRYKWDERRCGRPNRGYGPRILEGRSVFREGLLLRPCTGQDQSQGCFGGIIFSNNTFCKFDTNKCCFTRSVFLNLKIWSKIIDWFDVWSIDWLIVWLCDWLIDWLIDWFTGVVFFRSASDFSRRMWSKWWSPGGAALFQGKDFRNWSVIVCRKSRITSPLAWWSWWTSAGLIFRDVENPEEKFFIPTMSFHSQPRTEFHSHQVQGIAQWETGRHQGKPAVRHQLRSLHPALRHARLWLVGHGGRRVGIVAGLNGRAQFVVGAEFLAFLGDKFSR